MIRIFFILLLIALPVPSPAQELTFPPVDEAEEDAGFLAYRERLIDAVVARDIDAIVSMAAEDIKLNFGGTSGHEALRDFLTVDPAGFPEGQRHEAPALRERNWADLETVLRMGGVFDGEGRFVAPYTWSFEPPDGMDPFEVMFVTGTGVAMRDRPIRYGALTARLDHDVVRLIDWVSGTPYVRVVRADDTNGYVHSDYLRALVDYRAFFERRDGDWKMITFIAGD